MDRRARVEAEQELDDLMRAYEAALAQGSTSNDEVDRMRREIETQSQALRSMQERERASETSMSNQIASLEQALARERSEGALNADVASRREAELRHQREELDRLRAEREESDRRRVEAENARATAIAEAEQRRAAAEQARALAEQGRSTAEAEAARLRENVAQTSAALDEARTELARRDAASRERIETMRRELAKLADTRSSERGFIVTLPGLFFDSGKSVLKPGARNTLSRIADQLRTVEAAEIAIEGHTDSVGGDAMNQGLSEKRAAAVRTYLVSRGVPASRIKTSGLGESAPVASNDTPAGRQQNRRVELVIATPQQ
jgi:outer membrane protein OmpA-like peptidoglycan-associated protein